MMSDTFNCPVCGSKNIATEKRLNGNHICQDCHHRWKNYTPARDPRPVDRIDPFLNQVSRLWKTMPDLRFTQVLEVIKFHAKNSFGIEDLFYIEEDLLSKVINDLLKEEQKWDIFLF